MRNTITAADEISTITQATAAQIDSTPTADTADEPTIERVLTGITPADTDTAADEAEENTPVYLPADYLVDGYYATTPHGAKYLRAEYVGKYAEIMAALLADMKPSDFSALLRELKRSKKSNLPHEARMTAVLELIPRSIQLVSRHKAPPLLISFIKDNIDHIQNDDDWMAFYRHLEAIAAYMTL